MEKFGYQVKVVEITIENRDLFIKFPNFLTHQGKINKITQIITLLKMYNYMDFQGRDF